MAAGEEGVGDDIPGERDARGELASARGWLVLAVFGALVLPFALGAKDTRTTLLIVVLAWGAACVAGWNGLEHLLRAGEVSPTWQRVAPVGFFLPYASLVLLAWLLWRCHFRIGALHAQARVASAREAARARAARRAAADPVPAAGTAAAPAATSGAAATAKGLPEAIACVKTGGLQQVADGTLLQVEVSAGSMQIPPDQQPVLMAYKGFGVMFLVDEGSHFRYASHADVRAAGMTAQALLQTGLRNLARQVNATPGLKVARNGAFHGLLMGGHFEASLVLLDALWEGPLKQYAPGGFVVALPARDICAFCDAGSREGLEELRALARKITAGGDHLVTDALHARQGRGWAPLG